MSFLRFIVSCYFFFCHQKSYCIVINDIETLANNSQSSHYAYIQLHHIKTEIFSMLLEESLMDISSNCVN